MSGYANDENLQVFLKTKGFYNEYLDGMWGPNSNLALKEYLNSRSTKLTFNWRSVSIQRRKVAAWQLICLEAGIQEVGVIDGFAGPSTLNALNILESLKTTGKKDNWRDCVLTEDEPRLPFPTNENAPLWPRQDDVEKVYGPVGENQALLIVPYKFKLSWDLRKQISRISVHEKVHDSAQRVLNRVYSHYGQDEITKLRLDVFGGSLQVRQMRGGTKMSMHSWGIALDFDPVLNQLRWGRDRASLAKPEYNTWWKLWEEEGWVSLGRALNFDWMHVQAARL